MENYLTLIQSLKNNQLKNFYIISGEDSFLVSKAHDKIFEACNISCKDVDYARFDDENFDVGALCSALMQLPLIAEKRMIVVKNIAKLSGADKKKLSASFNLSSEIVFVVIKDGDYESFDFLPNATFIDCKKLGDLQIKNYIVHTLAKSGTKIREDACNELCLTCGNLMSRICTETEKLQSLCPGGIIEKPLVCSCVAKEIEYEVFALTNAIACKNGDEAFIILNTLLRQKQDPQGILALVISQIRRMLVCMLSQNSSDSSVAFSLGIKEFAIKKLRQNLKGVSVTAMRELEAKAQEVDIATKNSELPFEDALYYLTAFALK